MISIHTIKLIIEVVIHRKVIPLKLSKTIFFL